MTTVNSSTSTAAAKATGSASSVSNLTSAADQEDRFMKLLVAQMKNQDPTNPMDSTQYMAQLAAFSQVEQSVQMNTKLDQMLQSSTLAQADAIIGRTITSADGETSGKVSEVRLISNGIVAVLEGGKEVTVGPGVKIS